MKIGNLVIPKMPRGQHPDGRYWLTIEQVAERWECTPAVVRKAVRHGLPAYGHEGVVYVPLAEVVQCESKGGVSASGAAGTRSSGTTARGDDTAAPFGQIVEITLTLKRRDGSQIKSTFVRDPGT